MRVEQVKRQLSFVHCKYSLGIVSMDQRGGGGGLKTSRLYAFPDENEQVLHALTLGDKDSQSDDVRFCTQWVEHHLKQQAEEDNTNG